MPPPAKHVEILHALVPLGIGSLAAAALDLAGQANALMAADKDWSASPVVMAHHYDGERSGDSYLLCLMTLEK